MLHTKSKRDQPSGSREFKGFFLPFMGKAAIFIMWSGPFEQTFIPQSYGVSIKNEFNWSNCFRRDVKLINIAFYTHGVKICQSVTFGFCGVIDSF